MLWLQRDHYSFDEVWEHVDFQLLAVYDVVAAPDWKISVLSQPNGELWWVREGRCQIVLGNRRVVAEAGDAVILTAGERRITTNIGGGPLSIIGFSCRAMLLEVVDFLSLLDLPLCWPRAAPRLGEMLHEIVEERRAGLLGYPLATHGLAQMALVEVLRAVETRQVVHNTIAKQRLGERLRAAQSTDIAAALNFVAGHFDEQLDVPALAAAACLSPKHFSRKFKTALQLTPMEYLRRYRLRHAQDMLMSSDATVSQIAWRCGFTDPAHFSRAFKLQYGVSPLSFRHSFRSLMAGEEHSDPSSSKR